MTPSTSPDIPSLLPVSSVVKAYQPSASLAQDTHRTAVTKANLTRITEALSSTSGLPKTAIGTTSALLPVAGSSVLDSPAVIEPVLYSDHAITFLLGAVTWFKSLYTYTYTEEAAKVITPTYGNGFDHYAVLSEVGVETQQEQYKNFEAWTRTHSADNPAKSLYVYNCYRQLLTLFVDDLPIKNNNTQTLEILALLNSTLTVFPIKPLLAEVDYDRLSNSLESFVQTAVNNHYNLYTPSDYDRIYREWFSKIVTDVIVAHLGTESDIEKRSSSAFELMLHCAVRLMRDLLQKHIDTQDGSARQRLLSVLGVLLSVELDQVSYLYTDPYELVMQGQPVYTASNFRAIEELAFPLVKHYLNNKDKIKDARKYLLNDVEKEVLDLVTSRLDILSDLHPYEMQAIDTNNEDIHYTNLSVNHRTIGRALSLAIVNSNLESVNAFELPDRAFELYCTSVDLLYFDQEVAIQR